MMKMDRNLSLSSAAAVAAALTMPLCLHTTPARASGFALEESSAVEIGNAHAGQAVADDPSALVWNAAGIARLHGANFSVNLSGINYSPKFSNSGSTTVLGTPLSGGDGGNAGGLTLVPSLFFTAEVTPDVVAGVGVFTPFGLKTEYDSGWVGRYQAIRSQIETVNINPTVAWKATRQLSLGAGVDIMNASADTTRAVDFGAICLQHFGVPAGFGACGINPPGPPALAPGNAANDGGVEIKGSSWGMGWNVGAMFEPREGTRFGLTYRSRVREDIQGNATFVNPALPGPYAALTASPVTTSSNNATAKLWLPESATANFYTELNPQWAVLGNVNWTRWSRFNELRVRFSNTPQDNVTTFYWRDTWNISFAVNYQMTQALKLRAGVEYETDAARNGYRNPAVPESARKLVAVGANYRFTKKDSIDFGYSHVFFNNVSTSSTGLFGETLTGTYKVSADLFALQYNRSF